MNQDTSAILGDPYAGGMKGKKSEMTGPLAGHVRSGRRYVPALGDLIQMEDWIRDDLPDLVWPALLLAHRGTGAYRDFVHWQRAVQQDLAELVDARKLADGLGGRLSSLEILDSQHPDVRASITQRAAEHDLLPEPVADVLATYPDRPARWLAESELRPPDQPDIDLLMKAVLDAMTDGHREAIIKCLHTWSAVQAGTFRSDEQTRELLKPYPNDPSTRSQADSAIRASWGAMKGVHLLKDGARFDRSIEWAKVFWGMNSISTSCVRRRDVESAGEDEAGSEEGAANSANDHPQGGDHLERLAMDLIASYVEALETAPFRLYDNEVQEVTAGLVMRAGREVVTALGYPALWSSEHGAHVNRTLVEVQILVQWMSMQDRTIYQRFRDYGFGKAKLYSRILDELPTDARTDGFDEALDELKRVSHNDIVIDHRTVDTADSFSGKSIRAMAEECGLLDLYRRAYYIASGITHSEWWSVELHSMEPCLNVLHRGHLIPSMSLGAGRHVATAVAWVDQLHGLIRTSLRILGTDDSAVASAFAWLEEDVDPEG